MKVYDPAQFYPKEWNTYDFHAKRCSPRELNLSGTIGDINRFGARFRLAKAFRGLDLAGYTGPTADGYSALCRVLLAWSAFEQFMVAVGVAQRDLATLLSLYNTDSLQNGIRSIDKEDCFYRFIFDRVNQTHKDHLSDYFKANPCNITYLASAIRHIFAHGSLTPSAGEVEPAVTVQVCNRLSDALMSIMDTEFAKRMDAFVREYYDHGSAS